MGNIWRVVDDLPASAPWNMAVDEAILTSAVEGKSIPAIRFFQWVTPSITYGYMLDVHRELNISLCLEQKVPFVRRITGGGVVFHGCDITYAIIFPADVVPEASNPLASYRFINGIFQRAFLNLGVELELLPIDKSAGRESGNVNVCFIEPTAFDVLYNEKKLIGNAQRRKKGWVLNHGSIMFDTGYKHMADLIVSKGASELFADNCTSVEEISKEIRRNDVINAISKQFAEELNLSIQNGSLTEYEMKTAEILDKTKYSTDIWNYDRRVN